MPVIGGIAAGGQAALGLYQNIRASSLRKKAQQRLDENPYQIPESAIRSVNKMGSLSQGTRMAGQSQMEENLGAVTAQSIAGARRAAQTPSQILASTVASYSQKQEQEKQLDLAAQQDWQRRQGNYVSAIASLAPFEQKRWELNTLGKSQAEFNAASGMAQAGTQNISSGVQSGLSMLANQQYLNSLNTAPTNGMEAGSTITPIASALLASQTPQTNKLMPMNYRNPWWGGGLPDTSIQQRQGG